MRLSLWILAPLLAICLWGQERETKPTARKPRPSNEAAIAPASEIARPPAPSPTNVETEAPAFSDYRLGAEDLISVTVLEAPEFSRLARISGAGTIKLPLMKQPIQAAGMTSAELEQRIAEALVDEGLLREPTVSVTVREFHSKPVSVSGAVRLPTVFQATRPLTLVEAVTRAGGLSESASQEILVSFPERDGQPAKLVRVPAKSLSDTAGSDVWLHGGEEVRVPPAGRVYVLGGVGRPGAVLINTEESLTLLKALALAGGPTPTAATKAFLLRPNSASSATAEPAAAPKQEIALDLKKLVKRQQPDLPLQANDVIFVPESGRKRATQTGMSAAISTLIYGAGVLVWR